MQRSVGVTISAIVVLLGSLPALALNINAVLALMAPCPNCPINDPRASGFLISVVYLLEGAWGITTSIGLLRLRNWARISMIIFAALLPISGFPILLIPLLGPLFVVVLLGIAIWWLVFFNLAHVKAQFIPRDSKCN